MGIITNPRKEKRKEKKIISPTDLIPFRFTSDSKKLCNPLMNTNLRKKRKEKTTKQRKKKKKKKCRRTKMKHCV